MNNAYVKSSIDQGICTIEFFHPSQNSLPGFLLLDLQQQILAAGNNDDIRIIILKSGGDRTFCAGASFDELIAINDEETGHNFFMGFANVINACISCGKIVIGRVQGKAVGGGVGLASATDYCFGTKYAAIKLSELAVGIGPFVVGPSIERKIGVSAYSQLSLDATHFQNAYWAKDKGLFTEVFDNAREMDEAIEELAIQLSKSNPASLAALKSVFWEGTDHWNKLLSDRAALSGKLILSPYSKEAINRFKNK